MARKKKDGRRANGVQSKKGMLYIVTSNCVIKNGTRKSEKKWTATGLTDTPENIRKASELRQRIFSQDHPVIINKDITMGEYLDIFLEYKQRTVADTTYANYKNRSKRIRDYFNNVKIISITKKDVEQFLDGLFLDNCQPRTVNDIKVLLSGIMEMAIKDMVITTNPVKEATINKRLQAKATKDKSEDEKFFSYLEACNFLKYAEDHQLYELFYTTLFFGLRRSEVLGLKWDAINFTKKELRVKHTVTKGTGVNRLNTTKTKASTRTFPLNDDQIKMFLYLKEMENHNRVLFGSSYQENDYIFKQANGSEYYPDYPTKAFKKIILRHTDLPQDITFHGLRSSCVSILVHMGYDVKSIQKWAGHEDINTTLMIYAKAKDKEAKSEILKGMDELIKPQKYVPDVFATVNTDQESDQ